MRNRLWLGCLLTVLWAAVGGAQLLPADAKPTCTVTPAVFASWFKSGAVSLNGVVEPANSVTFPDVPNCSFYRWSEQMYLWLLSPAPTTYGSGRVFDSQVFYDVSPPDQNGDRTLVPHTSGKIKNLTLRAAQVGPNRLPIVFDKAGRMFEVEQPRVAPNGRPLILNRAGQTVEVSRVTIDANKRPVFSDAQGRTIQQPRAILRPELRTARVAQRFVVGRIPVLLDANGNVIEVELGQAGGGDALMAQNGSLIYYSTMVNDVYAYFLTGTKNGGITPTPTKFPTTQAELNKVVAFAAAHGKTFPDAIALAIEVKTSWIEAAGLPNIGSYITMTATVPTYNTSSQTQWIPNGQKTVKLAMVGAHIVGSAKGHPEMIWATYEHFGITPNETYSYISNTNATKTVPKSTAGTWLFSATNSNGPFNEAHMFASGSTLTAVNPFTISASNTIRRKAFGAATDFSPNPLVNSAASNTEVIAINNSVLGQIPNGDVRKNYYMTGSTWTIGGAAPTGSFKSGGGGGNEVGTSKLANSTMETYQQGSNTFWGTGTNCFTCHVTNQTPVSHIFAPTKPLFP